jgi:hypothetical protein
MNVEYYKKKPPIIKHFMFWVFVSNDSIFLSLNQKETAIGQIVKPQFMFTC